MDGAVFDGARAAIAVQIYTNWNKCVNTINHISAALLPRDRRRGNFPSRLERGAHSLFMQYFCNTYYASDIQL